MEVLFFGDSFTSAENNNFNGFVDKLGFKDYKNFGVSGTTLGEYSLYPVGPTDLLNMIRLHEEDIKEADIIFLEYGINDMASLAVDYAREIDIIIDYNRCLDYIRQLNSDVKIYYLIPSYNEEVINKTEEAQTNYLLNDYLKKYDVTFHSEKYSKGFEMLTEYIKSTVDKVIEMIPDIEFMNKYIDIDKIHPNDEGYQIIANNILKQLGE